MESIVVIRLELNRLQCGLQTMHLNHGRGGETLYHGWGVDVADIIYRNREPLYFLVVSQS